MSDIERCPTCGSTVRVVSGDEGTSHYEPIPLGGGSVPAIAYQGTVEAGNALAALLERPDADWPARDALAAWYAAIGPRE